MEMKTSYSDQTIQSIATDLKFSAEQLKDLGACAKEQEIMHEVMRHIIAKNIDGVINLAAKYSAIKGLRT